MASGRQYLRLNVGERPGDCHAGRLGMPTAAEFTCKVRDVHVTDTAKRHFHAAAGHFAEEERETDAAHRAGVFDHTIKVIGFDAVPLMLKGIV